MHEKWHYAPPKLHIYYNITFLDLYGTILIIFLLNWRQKSLPLHWIINF